MILFINWIWIGHILQVRSQMSTSRTSTIGVMRKIVAEEGLKALWKGVGPAMARAGCLTASQMATYDEAKQVSIILLYVLLERNRVVASFNTSLLISYSPFNIGLARVDTT